MTNRVAGILTTMEHWLERTADAPLQQFALDRDAVSQLVAALKAPAVEPECEHKNLIQADVIPPFWYCAKCGAQVNREGGL